MRRYYLGIDLGDRVHAVAVGDERGEKVAEMRLEERVEEMAEFGRWLDERRSEGIELWAASLKKLAHRLRSEDSLPRSVVRDKFRKLVQASPGKVAAGGRGAKGAPKPL